MGAAANENVMPGDERRSLLTEREKEILAGDADVTEKYFYVVVSRVRNKIEGVEDDLEFLEQHYPDLADELEGAVCGPETDSQEN